MNPTTDFTTFRAIRPDAGFCDWLRRSSGPLWAAMVGHRFTQDMAGDRLPPEAFLRYLRYEHAFVRTAILIFAQALIKAPAEKRKALVIYGNESEAVAAGFAPRETSAGRVRTG